MGSDRVRGGRDRGERLLQCHRRIQIDIHRQPIGERDPKIVTRHSPHSGPLVEHAQQRRAFVPQERELDVVCRSDSGSIVQSRKWNSRTAIQSDARSDRPQAQQRPP